MDDRAILGRLAMTVEEVRFNRFRVWHFIGYLIPFISQIYHLNL